MPNVAIERLIDWLGVKGIEEVIVRSMQILFGIATLAQPCITIYTDVRLMLKRANQQIAGVEITPMIETTPAKQLGGTGTQTTREIA